MTMNNDNVSKYASSKHVDTLADKLLEHFGLGIDSRPFMCKAAYKLSEANLMNNLEMAEKGKNKVGLFIYLCKRDGV